ncbi:hypothetical protein [Rhizobium sp. SYY.PMSO]|uniref:hypothetical protein n=1 Tax=Rhizobium sp. SYY.PMSO TaxID=3382192 RepID=UPI003990068E
MIKPSDHFEPRDVVAEFIAAKFVERGNTLPDKSFPSFAISRGLELRELLELFEDAVKRGVLKKNAWGAYFRR